MASWATAEGHPTLPLVSFASKREAPQVKQAEGPFVRERLSSDE